MRLAIPVTLDDGARLGQNETIGLIFLNANSERVLQH